MEVCGVLVLQLVLMDLVEAPMELLEAPMAHLEVPMVLAAAHPSVAIPPLLAPLHELLAAKLEQLTARAAMVSQHIQGYPEYDEGAASC